MGWIAFAGIMTIIGGSLASIFELVAIINDGSEVFTNRDAVAIDLTTWGWIQLIGGIVVSLAGFGVARRCPPRRSALYSIVRWLGEAPRSGGGILLRHGRWGYEIRALNLL